MKDFDTDTDFDTSDLEPDSSADESKSSLRDALEDAYDSQVDGSEHDASSDTQRSRDERGRYAKADETDLGATGLSDSTEIPEKASISAPQSWPAEKKALFAEASPALREFIAEREAQVVRGFQQKALEISRDRESISDLTSAIAPHADMYADMGVDSPGELVSRLIDADILLRTDPVNQLRYLCEINGVHPSQLLLEPSEAPQNDPRLNQLEYKIRAWEEQQAASTEAQHQASIQSLSEQIDYFKNEADVNGQPMRPHIDLIEDAMATRIRQLRQSDPTLPVPALLQKAYDDVVSPIRDSAKSQHSDALRQKSEKARRAASSLRGSPGGSHGQAQTGKDWRSVLEASYDALS